MTSKMSFGVPQVRDFLAKTGCVLTVRGYDYTTTAATVPDLNDIRIERKKVCEITTIQDIDGFVPLSGFKTASEWWVQIRRFCKGRMYLYRVQIDHGHISKQECDYEKREHQRSPYQDDLMFEHPLDIRGNTDPALVDLQPYKDAEHADRMQREERHAERRRERMRERYNEHGQINKTVVEA